MPRHYDTIDKSKQRKPRNTPWANYNPGWLRITDRRKSTPMTRREK